MDYDLWLTASHDAHESACAGWDDLVEAELDYVISKPALYNDYLLSEEVLNDTVTVDDGTELPPLVALVKYAPDWLRGQLTERMTATIAREVERRLEEERRHGGYGYDD